MQEMILDIFQFLLKVVGYILPLFLSYLILRLYDLYKQYKKNSEIEWTLFEIQIPREIIKSPATMELICSNAFFQDSWFSLEIVSIDGKIHFYIRTPTKIKKIIETQIYAQYPQAKVIEVEDYTNHIPPYHEDGNWNVWGCEFTKASHSARPIKTWRKMEEMKSGTKEEYKIDLITPTLEYLGSLSKGEQIWIQFVIRPSVLKFLNKSGKEKTFEKGAAQDEINNMTAPYAKKDEKGGTQTEARPPIFLEDVIKDMSNQMRQLHFDVGIRMMVLADKKIISDDNFKGLYKSSDMIFRQFSYPDVNELKKINPTQFDVSWSDPTGLTLNKIKKRMLDFFRTRTFFYPPLQYTFDYPFPFSLFFPSNTPKLFVMSVEELASIYHFPGMSSETPSFKRVDSKIAKPPANLPT